MTAKKVLVTGADGFIGSHLTELLVRQGYDVKAFVYYNSFHSWGWLDTLDPAILSEIDVFMGDIRDPFGVKTAMTGCDRVLHLAALIGIPYSYHSPQNYVETNITGTLNLLQAARELNIDTFIQTSTSEVYGTAQYVPIDEKHPLQPQSPYSATKIAADQMALSYYYAFELPVTIIRPFNTYGPRQSSRAVIPATITQMVSGARQIQLGSLAPTRDFTYVTDTAQGFIQALKAKDLIGKTINLGTGYEISIYHLVHLIAQKMGKEVEVVLDPARLRPEKSEVQRLLSDNQLAKTLLDWHPRYSDHIGLEAGIEQTIEWFLKTENQVKYKPELYHV